MSDAESLTGKQCAAARVYAGMSQQALADAAGVFLRTLIDFENGRRAAKPETKKALVKAIRGAGFQVYDNGAVAPGLEAA